jgi:hypothetical protein
MNVRGLTLKRCLAALRGPSRVPVILFVALAPAFKAGRPAGAVPRPAQYLLAGRNEAVEKRLRWSRARLAKPAPEEQPPI